jgi:hypothetical protein
MTRYRTLLIPAVFVLAATVVVGPLLVGQTPPAPLPPSVTGQPAPQPIQPVSATTAPAAPIARFQDLKSFPPETVAAVYSMRAGADWLWRMNQPNGRFFPGVVPALKIATPDDPDFRQACAALALARAAKFTGDERFATRAAQAVLVLLTLTKPDPQDATCRVPTAPSDKCNRVGFAAVVALAAYELPDAKMHAEAESLCLFLKKQLRADGSVHYAYADTDVPTKLDQDGVNVYPGLALEAIALSHRAKPEGWKRDAVANAAAYYRTWFQSSPTPLMAGTMLPAFAACAGEAKDDPVKRAAFEMADWLCEKQYTPANTAQRGWIGGFSKTGTGEPAWDSATCASGLACAVKLTRAAGDVTRYVTYRRATVDALTFARSLQFNDDSADHFEKSFRTKFLLGGVHLSPTDGTVRIDATAAGVAAHLAYLSSGGEMRAE